MVLIQLLLPTGAGADPAMTALAETRRELVDRFKGVTAYVRSPAKAYGPPLTATRKRTTE
jgi:hypothetical protein